MSKIKIVTVNVPMAYVEAIKKLVGEDGIYPSRSELIRCAVRELLIKELNRAKKIGYNEPEIEDFDSEHFVRVPKDDKNFKTYKIVRRLEL